MSKRIVALLLCLVLAAVGIRPAEAAEELSLASEAAVLMDARSGLVLYQKNMNAQMYPASITKVMTALLALRELNPDQVLTVSKTAVDAVPRTSSHVALTAGEELTVDQAMYALAMESANDAANVLAEAIGGSLSGFADRMNREAAALGALNTHFTNANGLPDSNHYTTAYDMALITAAALKNEQFSHYFSTVEYHMPATNRADSRTFANKDRLLPGGQYFYEGVIMAKTGFTNSAQGTFAAAARRGDTTLIVITLKSPLLEDKYKDTWKLLNYGFSHYTTRTMTGEELAARLPIGEYEPAEAQQFSWLLPLDGDITTLRFRLRQPLPEGQERVTAVVTAAMDGEDLGDANLILEQPFIHEDTIPVDAPMELAAPDQEAAPGIPIWLWAIGGCGVLYLLFVVTAYVRHQLYRRSRRRKLQARIQRMKRQSRK